VRILKLEGLHSSANGITILPTVVASSNTNSTQPDVSVPNHLQLQVNTMHH
jgi:hypothetical protein